MPNLVKKKSNAFCIYTAILVILTSLTACSQPAAQINVTAPVESSKNFGLNWTKSPDWLLKLSNLSVMNLDQHFMAQLIEAVAAAQEDAGNYDAAIRVLETGNQLFPQNALILYHLGLDLCLINPPRAAQYLTLAGELQGKHKDLSDSIIGDLANFPIAGSPQSLAISKSLAREGEWKTAYAALSRLTQLDPKNADAWILLGQAMEQLGLDGLDAYQSALKLEPRSIPGRASLAEYYANLGDRSKAMKIYSDLQKEEPGQPIWDIELGNLYSQSGDLVTAYGYFVDAIDLEPLNANYWIAMVNFCAQYHIYIEEVGLPAARKAVSLAPGNADALAGMGEMLLLESDPDSAAKFFQMAIDADPTNNSYRLYLGESYLKSGRMADAYRTFEKVFQKEGNSNLGLYARDFLTRNFTPKP